MEREEMQAFIETFKQLGFDSAPLSQYLQNKLSYHDSTLITETFIKIMKEHYVKIGSPRSEESLKERLEEMMAASQDDEFLANRIYRKELQEIERTKELPEEYK